MFTKLSQISDWRTDYRWRPENQQVETYVVQKYISNPYLVGGKKVRVSSAYAYMLDLNDQVSAHVPRAV